MSTEFESLFDPVIPEQLELKAKQAGWPDGLVARLVRGPWNREAIDQWITDEEPGVDEIRRWVDEWESLNYGTLRVRHATVDDGQALSAMFADSPEDIGEWEVTVERGPLPLAQFSLQENSYAALIEDRGVILGCYVNSCRNSLVGGKRVSLGITSAYRVRRQARGRGLSNLIRSLAPPIATPWWTAQYWYVRPQNQGAMDWMKALGGGLSEALVHGESSDGDVPGVPATVLQYPATAMPVPDLAGASIRPARRGDTRACVRLINRTHKGLDFFRPYSEEFLASRLDEGSWHWKPPWWTYVYSWSDYYVVERNGRVVACGGLWDRGAQVRERWRHKETGDERAVDATNLLDFGYADRADRDMTRLIEFFIDKTAALGRTFLVAPLQFLPEVAARLEHHGPAPDTRGVAWRVMLPDGGQMDVPDPPLRRPYTDLVYW